MKHIQSYSLYESKKALVSPTLSPITTYFETAQGSKYLLTQKGETKRWKSPHANTGGEDTGLKAWYPNSMFVPEDDIHAMMAYEHLTDKGYKCSLSKTPNGKLVWVIYKGDKWQPALYSDAFPTYSKMHPDKAAKPLVFSFSPTPVIGHMAVEYKQESNGLIRSFHPGSPVSKVVPIEKADPKDLSYFGIQ